MRLTFRQYQKSLIEDSAQKNSCTIKEAAFGFPDHVVRTKHGEECFRAAQNKIILPMIVLDSLLPLQRHRIFHDLPDYLSLWVSRTGRPYINPESRKESKRKFYDFRHAGFRRN